MKTSLALHVGMYSRASNTLYIETWLALHVECVVQLYTLHKSHVCFNMLGVEYSYTLYMKVALALHVGCIVQLHTLHEFHAHFTCWVYSRATHFT